MKTLYGLVSMSEKLSSNLILDHKAQLITYWWSNHDCKMLVGDANMYYEETYYWLKYYPFLLNNSSSQDLLPHLSWLDFRSQSTPLAFAPGNPGYGHFLCDTLPRILYFLRNSISIYSPYIVTHKLFPYQRQIIHALATSLDVTCRLFEVTPLHGRHSILLASKAIRTPVQPPFSRVRYLADFLANYKLPAFAKIKTKSRVALVRDSNKTSKYLTRLHNLSDVLNTLINRDFLVIRPEEINFFTLCHLLSCADIVFSEPGSILLNACVMCKSDCAIISPLAIEAFESPSTEIVIGGWAYNLSRPDIQYIPSLTTSKFWGKEFANIIHVNMAVLNQALDEASA